MHINHLCAHVVKARANFQFTWSIDLAVIFHKAQSFSKVCNNEDEWLLFYRFWLETPSIS